MLEDPNANLVVDGPIPLPPRASAAPPLIAQARADRASEARESYQFYPDPVLAALQPDLPFDQSRLIDALELRSGLVARLNALQVAGTPISVEDEGALLDEIEGLLGAVLRAAVDAPPVLRGALQSLEERIFSDTARLSRMAHPPVQPEPPLQPPAPRPRLPVGLDPVVAPAARAAVAAPKSRRLRWTRRHTLALGGAVAAALLAFQGQRPSGVPAPAPVPFAPAGSLGAVGPAADLTVVVMPGGTGTHDVAEFKAKTEAEGKVVREVSPGQFLVVAADGPQRR